MYPFVTLNTDLSMIVVIADEKTLAGNYDDMKLALNYKSDTFYIPVKFSFSQCQIEKLNF